MAETERLAPRWPRWLFRITATIAAVMLFDQAIFAGQFLAGNYASLATHADNADLAAVALLLSTIAAILLKAVGRGPGWLIAVCAGMWVLVGLQIGIGYARILALHVPLGVALIGLAVFVAVWAWRSKP